MTKILVPCDVSLISAGSGPHWQWLQGQYLWSEFFLWHFS